MIEIMEVLQVLSNLLIVFSELPTENPAVLLSVLESVSEAVNTLIEAGFSLEDAVRIVQFIVIGL